MARTEPKVEISRVQPFCHPIFNYKESSTPTTPPPALISPAPVSQPNYHKDLYRHRDHASTSHLSSLEAAESLGGTSTASFSQPTSPAHSIKHPPRTYSDSTQGEKSNARESNLSSVEGSRGMGNHRERPGPLPPSTSRPTEDITTYLYDEDDEMEQRPMRLEDKAPQILVRLWELSPTALINLQLYFCVTAPIISTLFSFYTAISVLGILLASPLSICFSRSALPLQIIDCLSPLHRFHLSQIHSNSTSSTFSATSLVMIHLASPILATGFAVAAWIAASFWAYAAILGDPDGRGRSKDGARTVLKVRSWWETLLYKAYRR
jgi:hypothetical protein